MVCFAPLYAMENELRDATLRIIDVPGASLHEELWMCTRKGKAKSPLHEAAVHAIKARVAAPRH